MEDNRIILLARQMGELIQQENCYKRLEAARIASDEDAELQKLFNEFNDSRMTLNEETMKKDRDQDKIQEYNNKIREIYSVIMNNEHMVEYNQAKTELDQLLDRVNAIINQSAQGEDPQTTDLRASCHGECSGCAGCG
ncbi:MAG: YlbF family regulator [Ruminococcus sp.]|nr:YlbF family regulator [Ruminococcus sp.]